jgi:predicted methyltransferase
MKLGSIHLRTAGGGAARPAFAGLSIVIALAFVAACGTKKKEEAPAPAGSAMAAPAVPVDAPAPIPPYTPAADVPQPIKDAIAAPDRSDSDRRLDAGRKPGEVLAFFKVAPGQKIGELFAGGGYTSELLARVIGDSGHLWSENTKEAMDKFLRKPWTARAAEPAMKNVTTVELPVDAPFPPDAKKLDAVITVLNYHDTVNMKADRAKMNKAVFDALKPGGIYGIVDSSAAAGSGVRDTETLHRIDEDVVKQEVQAAGFTLAGESDVLRNPADKRDWSSSPRAAGERRGTSDRFVLRFIKPLK